MCTGLICARAAMCHAVAESSGCRVKRCRRGELWVKSQIRFASDILETFVSLLPAVRTTVCGLARPVLSGDLERIWIELS